MYRTECGEEATPFPKDLTTFIENVLDSVTLNKTLKDLSVEAGEDFRSLCMIFL